MKKIIALLFVIALFAHSKPVYAQESFIAHDEVTSLTADHAMILYCSTCSAGSNGSKLRNWIPSIIGLPTDANGSFSLGGATAPTGTTAMAIGDGASTGSADDVTAIGRSTVANQLRALAVGDNAHATAGQAMAFGYNSTASGTFSLANATQTSATGLGAAALTPLSTASGDRSVAVGYNLTCSTADTVCIADSGDHVAIGNTLTVTGKARVPSPKTVNTSCPTVNDTYIGGTIVYNSTGTCTLTIPDTLNVNNGDFMGVEQWGTGTVTFASSGTMNLRSYDGYDMLGANTSAVIHFASSNDATITGHLN